MKIEHFLEQLNQNPTSIAFGDTITTIETNYDFTPTAFQNGNTHNGAGTNSGSCKLFAFAKAQNLTQEQTLACFGSYYFDEVLGDPDGTSHQNIRNFMVSGWNGIQFEGDALARK